MYRSMEQSRLAKTSLGYHKDGIDLKFPLVSSCLILSWFCTCLSGIWVARCPTIFANCLGLLDEQLSFSKHMQQQINKANSIMGLIRRTCTYLDEQSFKYLFQALLRPHLEYIWQKLWIRLFFFLTFWKFYQFEIIWKFWNLMKILNIF
jgi:hypothetical protein